MISKLEFKLSKSENMYKGILNQETHHSGIEFLDDYNIDNLLTENHEQLIQICKCNSIPSSTELKTLYNYCIQSSVDDIGINLFLFNLAFNNDIESPSVNLAIHTLMKTCQVPSFDVNQFLNSESIDCLINHILSNSQLTKYAYIFLINLLYETDKRFFLRKSTFFNLFEPGKHDQNLDDLIFAFFSDFTEIDQEIFDKMSSYISKNTFSFQDIHKNYRYLLMVLSLAEKNIKFENIDALIIKNIKCDENFMIEIILCLIKYSENPQNYFTYMISNFKNKFDVHSIIKETIQNFNFCWNSFNCEQKKMISNIISSTISKMPYSLRFHCVIFICNVKDWNIFNSIIFFEEIFGLITEKDISLNCLEAIYSFLTSDTQNEGLYLQIINLLVTYSDDLYQIAYSDEEPQNVAAQLLMNVISDIVNEENT